MGDKNPILNSLGTMKSIVSASLTGQHDKVTEHTSRLALEAKAMVESDPASSTAVAVMDFAQWIDGQLAHIRHERRGSAATLTVTRAAEYASRTDPVQNLLSRRVIDGAELRAARRIERIFNILAAGRGLQARDYHATRVDGSGSYQHPVDRMSYADSFEITMVYRPWWEQMHVIDVGAGTSRKLGLSCYDLVKQVLVDRRTLRSIETRYRIRHGTLTAPLLTALRHYNTLFGAATENDGIVVRAEGEEMKEAREGQGGKSIWDRQLWKG